MICKNKKLYLCNASLLHIYTQNWVDWRYNVAYINKLADSLEKQKTKEHSKSMKLC